MIARLTHAHRRRLQAMRHGRPFRQLARAAHAFRRELAGFAASMAPSLSVRPYTVVFHYPDEPHMPAQTYHVSARSLAAAVRQAEGYENWLNARAGWPDGRRRPVRVAIASEGWTYPKDQSQEYDEAPW
ncbi:hypothetical protein ACGF12_30500 [Kitasatospora sp. NPDC048296]|uniref:hypothetical protein n=1 Tax=Kitasatospora sp. NPDC048296 TaxID=3364048 RepID=UPI003713F4E8